MLKFIKCHMTRGLPDKGWRQEVVDVPADGPSPHLPLSEGSEKSLWFWRVYDCNTSLPVTSHPWTRRMDQI